MPKMAASDVSERRISWILLPMSWKPITFVYQATTASMSATETATWLITLLGVDLENLCKP